MTATAALQVMSTQRERRERNDTSTFSVIKTGFNSIFDDPRLGNIVQNAVLFVTPILIQRDLLANLHALQLCETDGAIVDGPKGTFNQQFFNQCCYAVTLATGFRCTQYDRSSNPSLTNTLELFEQHLPAAHVQPERPTYLGQVSSQTFIFTVVHQACCKEAVHSKSYLFSSSG